LWGKKLTCSGAICPHKSPIFWPDFEFECARLRPWLTSMIGYWIWTNVQGRCIGLTLGTMSLFPWRYWVKPQGFSVRTVGLRQTLGIRSRSNTQRSVVTCGTWILCQKRTWHHKYYIVTFPLSAHEVEQPSPLWLVRRLMGGSVSQSNAVYVFLMYAFM